MGTSSSLTTLTFIEPCTGGSTTDSQLPSNFPLYLEGEGGCVSA